MAIRLSGLISGMDTDAMVEELVKAYSTKKDKYVKAQTKLEWKQDAWKELNTKIYNFYSKSLSNLRFSNAFSKKTASASSSKATVTASSNSVIGTQSLKINQLAKSGYLTGAVVSSAGGEKLKGSSKLGTLGITGPSSFQITSGGKTTDINVDENTTVSELVVKLKDAGVSANFDETNQRFFVSAKKSGAQGDFNINANSLEGVETLKSLGLYTTTASDMKRYEAMKNMDIAAMTMAEWEKKKTAYTTTEEQTEKLQKEIDAYNSEWTALDKTKSLLEYKKDYAGKSFDEKSAEYNRMLDEKKALEEDTSMPAEDKKAALAEVNAKLDVIREVDVAIGSDTLTPEDRQAYIDEVGAELDAVQGKMQNLSDMAAANRAILEGTADAATLGYHDIDSYVEYVNNQIDDDNEILKGSIRQYYTKQQEVGETMVKADEIVKNYASLTNPTDEEKDKYQTALETLGQSGGDGTAAVRIAGEDAYITLNGAEFTSTTNSFSVNGLTIQANALTDPDEEITLTTDQDSQGIYDMVKNFLKEYNELVIEMDKRFNASSAKGYEPLTDEEKEAMTESEIDKWETKIKDSLLRRDSTLDSVTSVMKMAMNATFEINGKKYSLSSFGIKTSGYFVAADNEKGAYHIDGDSDDAATSGNADKLLKAIASDPDTVTEFFNKLAENLYTKLSDKMESSSVSSAYKVYNDKQMQKDYDRYDDIIDEWEDKVERYEEKYRKQFSAMESALSKLNSQQSQLNSLLGIG